MAWRWRAELDSETSADPALDDPALDDPALGVTLTSPQAFSSQSAAEAWLTSTYADLAEQGVRAVSLYEEDRLVYGPMSLDAG